ncbi:MAG: glycosyltransferase family 2 protein [Planctomycetaceae bacterium]
MIDQSTRRDAETPPEMVSVVVPVFNEEESLELMYRELSNALRNQPWSYELIFVNDGSSDRTAEILDVMAKEDPAVLAIHFRRNYGQTAAMSAGIDHSSGEIVVPIDGDLQNDPADIPRLVAKLQEGYDVVSGWRKDRQDRAITRKFPSRCANWLISKISGVNLHDYGCTLKAYRRDVMSGVRLYGEMHRFVPIYAHMQGGAITEMVVNHRSRKYGSSKYGLSRIYKVLLDLMLVKFLASYASKPMYVFGGFGLLCLTLSALPIGLALWFKFTTIPGMQKDFVETPLPVVSSVMVLVGFLAILQGLLAEVLMRTYFESQGKRTYQVSKSSRTLNHAVAQPDE